MGGSMDGMGGSMGGAGGSGGMTNCPDTGPGELNETEATATALADVEDDCDSNFKTVLGVLSGPTDVDWYVYDQLADSALCTVDPDRDWSQTSGGQLRVCKFLECQTSQTPSFNCPSNTTADTSPEGRPGCCGVEPFAFGASCVTVGADLLTVYVRVDEPSSAADNCNEYNLVYAF